MYADVVESLLERLDVSAVHVLAHDIGDTVAQELMARHISRQSEGGLTGRTLFIACRLQQLLILCGLQNSMSRIELPKGLPCNCAHCVIA